ncbi:hypothetical protein CLOSTMETH_01166 [[Clostridium] methylpentosum DSM 5476]|uniref:Uncharacterized protein n=1 Tax=[Clostridium] methylpentosum DSM 5476 TaxID=537013 RepID=C0EBE8_9FIRM|nr:hypothetical protein CLOSTMETH_01166 [[Clostridium] methylpentosum DSM 5476]
MVSQKGTKQRAACEPPCPSKPPPTRPLGTDFLRKALCTKLPDA